MPLANSARLTRRTTAQSAHRRLTGLLEDSGRSFEIPLHRIFEAYLIFAMLYFLDRWFHATLGTGTVLMLLYSLPYNSH